MKKGEDSLSFELFGLTFRFTPLIVFVSAILTMMIYMVMEFITAFFRFLHPFKRDPIANQAVKLLNTIRIAYYTKCSGYVFYGKARFELKLSQIESAFGYEVLQDQTYREKVRDILHKNYDSIVECFSCFRKFTQKGDITRQETIKWVYLTEEMLNQLIVDLNRKFETK